MLVAMISINYKVSKQKLMKLGNSLVHSSTISAARDPVVRIWLEINFYLFSLS